MSFFILLSGFMFPYVAMPKVARYIAEILPLTHFIRVIRGIMLRNEPLAGLMGDIWFLVIFATIFLVFSALRFSKKLD